MRIVVKDDVIVVVPEDGDAPALDAYLERHAGDVFELLPAKRALTFRNLGPRPEACREPINIGSRVATVAWRPISNFARTPFELDGRTYASIESFWQGLKFPAEADRRRIAPLSGIEAKKSGKAAAPAATFRYGGCEVAYGGPDHWALMRRACEAKFTQDRGARDALLSTGTRPLEHRMRVDSRSIPGVMMSRIWMDVRARLRRERTLADG